MHYNFLTWNKYPQWYLDLIDPKTTSDNKADPLGTKEKEQPIFWIKKWPEHLAEMEKFIQLLDEKCEKKFCYTVTKCCWEHIRWLASQPQETLFTSLAQELPLNYFDPIFFNNLQWFLHKKIVSCSITLLPDIEKSFTGCPDELLSDSLFNTKYGKAVLVQYKLDDLDGDIDKEKIFSDDKVIKKKNEFEDVEIEDHLKTSQIAFVEDIKDLEFYCLNTFQYQILINGIGISVYDSEANQSEIIFVITTFWHIPDSQTYML